MKESNKKGFTLIELLVVVAIIGLLSSIVMASLNTARSKARDARRRSDLHQIEIALALYYDTNGAYPAAGSPNCNGLSSDSWCRDIFGGSNWIPGLAPTYISSVPKDDSSGWGYLYSPYSSNQYWLMTHLENYSTDTCKSSGGGTHYIWWDNSSDTCTWGGYWSDGLYVRIVR